MSTELDKDVICPQCGQSQKYKLYTSISAQDNPELKEMVMLETLFDWRCHRCNYFAQMAYPFVYTDAQGGYIICFSPGGNAKNVESTGEIAQMRKRAVKNLAEMKEKILIFDENLNDAAMELVKNALCGIIKVTYKADRVHAYFCRENEGELEFAIFLPGKNDPVYHSTKVEVYNQSQEVLRTLDFKEPRGFVVVDAKLARRILEDYQNV